MAPVTGCPDRCPVADAVPALPGPFDPCPGDLFCRAGAVRLRCPKAAVEATGGIAIHLRETRLRKIHRGRTRGMTIHWRRRDGGSKKIGVDLMSFDPARMAGIPVVAGAR